MMIEGTGYFGYVPSDPIENMEWRIKIRTAALHDLKIQSKFRQACYEDILFFFQSSMWVVEPRSKIKILPMVLWPHQIPAILSLDSAITDSENNLDEPMDVVVDKSRAQGASWICLGVILHRWLRDPMFAAGLVSRNLESVDNPNDPDALMSKLDWAIGMLPFWLRPEKFNYRNDRITSRHSWTNPDTGGSIVGYSATSDVASGGRKTVILFDEVAKFDVGDAQDAMYSTQFVANCRFFVSTHKGDSGVYYDMVFGDAAGKKIILDWKDNPTQTRLAYRVVADNYFPEKMEDGPELHRYIHDNKAMLEKLKRRGFIKERALRSPWYDRQCSRKGMTPRGIAQELDRDPRGTVGKLFNMEVLDAMKKHVRAPVWEGRVIVHDGSLKLIQQDGGPMKLWFAPGLDYQVPKGKYCVGCDIGTGGGVETFSNSAMIGADAGTGEQVLEYADPTISETRFARLAVAVCKWLNSAKLIWEAQGPTGRRFATTVMREVIYDNIWIRPDETGSIVRGTKSKAGWVNNKTSDKADLFEDFWMGMDENLFTPRSEDMLRECGGWEWDSKNLGKIIYSGTGHGDRSIGGGLCWKAMKDFIHYGIDKVSKGGDDDVQYGTMAWRIEQQNARDTLADEESGDGFGVKELLSVSDW